MSTPSSAPRPVATITAVGTASPMAQGQAMINTATPAVETARTHTDLVTGHDTTVFTAKPLTVCVTGHAFQAS